MKLSKKITFGCLVLCFLLLLNGCQYIPGLSRNPDKNESAKNENNTKQQVQDKQKEVDDLREKLQEQEKNLGVEKQKCDDMTKDTIKIHKDPQNRNESPQTYAQCQKSSSAEKQRNETKDNLEKANQDLEFLKKQDDSPSTNVKNPEESNFSWLFWLAGIVVGLAGIVALGWLAYSIVSNSFEEERKNTLNDFRMANKNTEEVARKVAELEKTVKLQSGQFTQIQTSLQSLQKQIVELGGREFPQQAVFTQPYKPEPQFPAAAETYLPKIRQNAQIATADHYIELLVQDSNKGEEFLIVKDKTLAEDSAFAVPNAVRFTTKNDFQTYYQKYYDCENPQGGAVWINSPAIVRRVANGWELTKKGELEVR